MSANSKIEWTDHTFNPWIGCTKVSPGCAHCYAEQRDRRHLIEKVDHWGKGAPRLRTSESNWKQPILWNDHAVCEGCREFVKYGTFHVHVGVSRFRRPRVFCASLADIFDDEVQIEWLADLLALIHATPDLDWLLLTKRPENFFPRLNAALHNVLYDHPKALGLPFAGWVSAWSDGEAPANVWIGTSVEDQKRADARIPQLLQIPARVRFLSCEPLLGPVDLHLTRFDRIEGYNLARSGIGWVIAGGESGHGARPMHPYWARSLRDQCVAAGVPFFFKQWGEFAVFTPHAGGDLGGDLRRGKVINVRPRESDEIRMPGCVYMHRVGKHAAGRLLDGRELSEFPSAKSAPVTRVKERPGFRSAVQLS